MFYQSDMRVVEHECGSASVKLLTFDPPAGSVDLFSLTGPLSPSVAKLVQAEVVRIMTQILQRSPPCGVFLSRLRLDFFKETGGMASYCGF